MNTYILWYAGIPIITFNNLRNGLRSYAYMSWRNVRRCTAFTISFFTRPYKLIQFPLVGNPSVTAHTV